jgi:heptaprenyl diphosphate synthase
MKKRFTAKRIALLGVLTALALVMFIVESLFSPLFIPGAKMGLSNIFTLLCVILLGGPEAVVLIIVRTTVGSLFTGGLSSLMYSLPAGLVSVLVTALLYKLLFDKISVVSISVVSAIVHNTVQNVIFCLVTQSPQLFTYLPYLALVGILAGAVVGVAVVLILKYLPLNKMLSDLDDGLYQTL